jgi:plastocyanin
MASLPVVLLGLVALAGCGSSSNSSSSTPSTPATTAAAAAPATTSSAAAATTTSAAAASTSAPVAGKALSLEANPEGQLKYNKTELSATAGKVSIAFTNMSPLGHNMTIANAAGTVLGATPTIQGSTSTLSLNLKPGTYTFYCSVPGHRMAGMEGKLVVK